MLRTIDSAASLASHAQRRFSPGAWPPLATLRAMCEALREGLTVHRQYEELRSKGFAHDAALRQALVIDPPPSQPARDKRSACTKNHARCARHAYVGH
jgi:hypothetical protein